MSHSSLDLSILKVLISNKKHAVDFANDCDAKLFSSEVWTFANLVVNYIKTYKDIPTLRVLTEKLSKGNNDKLIEHINKTWDSVSQVEYDDKEYQHDLDKLKKRFAEKQISSVKESLSKLEPGSIDISKTLGDMQKTIQSIKDLDRSKAFENKNIKEYLPTFVEKFNAKKNNPDLEVGLLTKYSFLDFATNGLKPADFVLIAGESGFGKSLFLNNIAVQVWMQSNTIESKSFGPGKDIIYFSLEMPYEDCFNRLLSRLSGVPVRNIENARLTKEDFAKVRQALDFIDKYPHQFKIVDIIDVCADDLENILVNSEQSYDAVFVDYLGIMKTNQKSNDSDWLMQGQISYELRAIARKYEIPMFSAVQLNRKAPNKESSENIGLNRLARSGTIATHATHVIQIESRPNEEMHPDFLVHLIKCRKGPKLKGTLMKNLSCATLLDKPIGEDGNPQEQNFYDVDDISEEIENLDL
jgi:replicative DNA helicase